MRRFHWRGQHLCKFIATKEYEKSSTPKGLVWNISMAAVSFFWNTNMAAFSLLWNTVQHGCRFIVLEHQHGCRFIVVEHQHGRRFIGLEHYHGRRFIFFGTPIWLRNVMWKALLCITIWGSEKVCVCDIIGKDLGMQKKGKKVIYFCNYRYRRTNRGVLGALQLPQNLGKSKEVSMFSFSKR